MKNLKTLSLFSGIGAPEKALRKLGINCDLIGFSEIDKFAVKSYCATNDTDESFSLGDITKIDINSLPLDIDLITHGSPCTSFSVAGKQQNKWHSRIRLNGKPKHLGYYTVEYDAYIAYKNALGGN